MLDSLYVCLHYFFAGSTVIAMSTDEHDDEAKEKEKPEYKTWTGWLIPRDEAEADDMNFDPYDVDGVKWDGYLHIDSTPLLSVIYTRSYLKLTNPGLMIEGDLGYEMVPLNYVYRYVRYKGRCLLAIARTVEEAEAVLGDPVMLAAVCAKQVRSRKLCDFGIVTGPWFKDETMGDDSNG